MMAIDYSDIENVNELLENAQEAEKDNRDQVREVHNFLDKRDGQWEPDIIARMSGRPRYTFDKCNPVVDDIAGEMEQADFDLRIRPSGGKATKDIAKVYDGLVREIENISNASKIYSAAGREMVAAGLGGWEVTHDWVDGDSFEQDLFITPIHNFEDRVWFDEGAELQDASDARHVFVLQNLTPDEYDDKFPEGSKTSIGDDRAFNVYTYKPDFITVGRLLYKEEVERTLVLMSDQSVYERDDDFEKIVDELAQQGITILRERKKKKTVVVSRLFDGQSWLTDKQKTVFKHIPIVPTYGNYKIRESKVIYRGAIDKLIDPQRVYNYARSREVEEVALSPRAKYWATRKQLSNADDRAKVSTLNTNADPVQLYTHDPENPGPPQQLGGALINPGIQNTVQNSLDDIASSSGRLSVQSGETNSDLSGIAIQSLQNKGDNASIKYFNSQEIAICQTGKILIDAIPLVYDTLRQKRILSEDGSFDMVTLNEQVFDQQTQKMVTINDLRQGKYDVTCDVGPAFKNRQQESVKALTDLIAAVPGLGEISADVLMKNIASPGVDVVGERVRRQLVQNGTIPESQLTDEEKSEIAEAQQLAAQQPPESDPVSEAILEQTQAQTADVLSKAQERSDKTELKAQELRLKEQDQLMSASNRAEMLALDEMKLFMQQQQKTAENQQATIDAQIKGQESVFNILNQQADTLKTIREAMGVDTFVGPHVTEAFIQQAETITDQQDEIQLTPETDAVTDSNLQSP